jgi:hypothetical protein
MQSVLVSIGVNRNRAKTQRTRGSHNPYRNLTAIRYQ